MKDCCVKKYNFSEPVDFVASGVITKPLAVVDITDTSGVIENLQLSLDWMTLRIGEVQADGKVNILSDSLIATRRIGENPPDVTGKWALVVESEVDGKYQLTISRVFNNGNKLYVFMCQWPKDLDSVKKIQEITSKWNETLNDLTNKTTQAADTVKKWEEAINQKSKDLDEAIKAANTARDAANLAAGKAEAAATSANSASDSASTAAGRAQTSADNANLAAKGCNELFTQGSTWFQVQIGMTNGRVKRIEDFDIEKNYSKKIKVNVARKLSTGVAVMRSFDLTELSITREFEAENTRYISVQFAPPSDGVPPTPWFYGTQGVFFGPLPPWE